MITIQTEYLAPSDRLLPGLAMQITKLTDSYMLWVGIAEGPGEELQKAALQGNLCKDWACAMPPRVSTLPALATPLFRTTTSDVAVSMAQRIAKRFHKQIYLSVDIPSALLNEGHRAKLLLDTEKGIVEKLEQLERA